MNFFDNIIDNAYSAIVDGDKRRAAVMLDFVAVANGVEHDQLMRAAALAMQCDRLCLATKISNMALAASKDDMSRILALVAVATSAMANDDSRSAVDAFENIAAITSDPGTAAECIANCFVLTGNENYAMVVADMAATELSAKQASRAVDIMKMGKVSCLPGTLIEME